MVDYSSQQHTSTVRTTKESGVIAVKKLDEGTEHIKASAFMLDEKQGKTIPKQTGVSCSFKVWSLF